MEKAQTSIELYVIEAVKKRRIAMNIVPRALSIRIGLDESYVGCVENPKLRAKYNLNHLNEIAKVLKCSVADFLPAPYMENDCIQEYKIYRKKGIKN